MCEALEKKSVCEALEKKKKKKKKRVKSFGGEKEEQQEGVKFVPDFHGELE